MERKRLNRLLIILGAVFLTMVAYLIFVLATDIKIPCVIAALFDFECPGCGITRMFVALARLDFYSAFCYNGFILLSLPLILLLLFVLCYTYVKEGKPRLGKFAPVGLILAVCMLVFGVLRNFF